MNFHSNNSIVFSASMMSAIGAILFLTLPPVLGTMADTMSLKESEIGFLGSAYLAGFTLTGASAVLWVNRVSLRKATLMGLALLIFGSALMSIETTYATVFPTFLLVGCGAGLVFAVATHILAGTPNPNRAFGLKLFAEQIVGASLIFMLPALIIPVWGYPGVMLTLSAAFFVLGLFAFLLPNNAREQHYEDNPLRDEKEGSTFIVWLGILSLVIFMLGLSGVWAFIERIAQENNISQEDMGLMLSIGLIFGGIGGAIAAIMGTRFGNAIPLIVGTVLLTVCMYLLSGNLTVLTFGIAAILFSGMWNFMLAFQMGLVAINDVSGKWSVLMAPGIAMGATIGPAVAGVLKEGASYAPVYGLAVGTVLISTLIFLGLDRHAKQNK